MYIIYGKVFGGTPNICMFWLFPENGSISERTVNRALIFLKLILVTLNHHYSVLYLSNIAAVFMGHLYGN